MANFTLNKKLLIANCAERTNLPKARIMAVIDAIDIEITEHLQEGIKVQVPGLGLAKPFIRKPRRVKGLGMDIVTKPTLGVRLVLKPALRGEPIMVSDEEKR